MKLGIPVLLVLISVLALSLVLIHTTPVTPPKQTGSTVEIVHTGVPQPATSTTIATTTTADVTTGTPPLANELTFMKVKDGCGFNHAGTCVKVRSGPSTSSPIVAELRNGIVLATKDTVVNEGREWLHIGWNEWLRYPSRVSKNWYVAKDVVETFSHVGTEEIGSSTVASSTKRILVDRSDQTLYAYEGDELVMKIVISTGTDLNPTPRGAFQVYKKTPSRYMQGPLPGISDQYYDLPGVPWNLYFTPEGGAIHGAYWHNSFGKKWSHGCVNVPPEDAQKLYDWTPLGTPVFVRD